MNLNQLVSQNSLKLEKLSSRIEGDVLVFEYDNEIASIEIEDGRIKQVSHSIDNNSINISHPLKTLNIGKRNFQRYVEHFLIKNSNSSNLLRLGQTFHSGDGGTWSSLPHDFENHPEPGFEEIFFYILEGGSKRAIQVGKGMLHDGTRIDDAWIVQDKSFSVIPMGYHPVGGEPDVVVSYIWCYACTHDRWEKV